MEDTNKKDPTKDFVVVQDETIIIQAKIPPVDPLCGCDKAAIRIEAIRNLFNFARR